MSSVAAEIMTSCIKMSSAVSDSLGDIVAYNCHYTSSGTKLMRPLMGAEVDGQMTLEKVFKKTATYNDKSNNGTIFWNFLLG